MSGASNGTEIALIRHAQAQDGGRLAGRRDIAAQPIAPDLAARLRAEFGTTRVLSSPALRCRQTAQAIFGTPPETDPRLWEQDFGTWEGTAYTDLPDLGPLSPEALADHRPPGGESFADLCLRTAPALRAMTGPRVAVVCHAGTIRAALALATGCIPGALAFQIAPLSVTRIIALPGGAWSIMDVNRVFA